MQASSWERLKQLVGDALEQPEDQRAGFLEAAAEGDEGLRQEAVELLAAEQRAEVLLEPRPGTPGTNGIGPAARRAGPGPGDAIERWRLVRPLGSGGMGEVFEALREGPGFSQRSALKLVRADLESPTALARFERERALLAGLEHPGIARLIDGGQTAAGAPFIAMEFVDGQPLDRWCDQRRLPLRARVELLREVCAAVEHAHANLVVHGDLKPDNVLVTEAGRAVLVDFGVARAIHTPAEGGADPLEQATSGQRFFTPRYASPEQVRGERVTTLSDVYSLGVILYELLTGRRPYEFTSRAPREVERVICETHPVRPSTAVAGTQRSADKRLEAERAAGQRASDAQKLARNLHGDLDQIALKALAKEPLRRYASARELSLDLERWLERRPVLARPDSAAYRASKALRRNPLAWAAALIALVALLAGTILSTTLWLRGLERERELAQRLEGVQGLAEVLLNDVQAAVRALPGSTPVRRDLMRTSLAHLERLEGSAGQDLDFLRTVADGYRRLGEAEGGWRDAGLGELEAAEGSLRRQLELRERIAARSGLASDRLSVARARRALGDLVLLSGSGQAEELQRAGLAEIEALQGAGLDAELDLAQGLHALGQVLQAARRGAEARELYERSRTLVEPLERSSGERGPRRLLRQVCTRLGELDRAAQDWDSARANLEVALELALELHAQAPDETTRGDLVLVRDNLGVVAEMQGRGDEALELYEQNLTAQRELFERDPLNAVARERLLLCHIRVGDLIDLSEDYSGSQEHYARGLELARAALAATPARTEARVHLANLLARWAWTEKQIGSPDHSAAAFDEASELCREVLAGDAGRGDVREVLEYCARMRPALE